jgi:NTE family protein
VPLELMQISLFEGLEPEARNEIYRRLQPRNFAPGEVICREGDAGSSLFIIESGLAHVLVSRPEGPRIVARLRRGDFGGEMSLITGEPRSATLKAIVPTTLLELGQQAFGSILASYPILFANLARILSQRLARADAQLGWSRQRGETVALVAGRDLTWQVAQLLESVKAASPREVVCVDLTASLPPPTECRRVRTVEEALSTVDDLLDSHGLILIVADLDQPELASLLQQVDRVFLLGTEVDCLRATRECGPGGEVVIIKRGCSQDSPRAVGGLNVIRTIDPDVPHTDVAWVGRHLSRTKIGLALGAGGAKGFAHVAALEILEAAGYPVDYVAGSSIGAFVGSWLALGKDAAAIKTTMRRTFSPDNVASIFKLSFGGMATGADELKRLCYESTEGLSFSDLVVPLVIMAVDLKAKRATAITEGPLWEALMAAGTVPGLYPPYELNSQRLVDAIALVPVPADAVRAAGADIVVSINLMSWDTLPAWPANAPLPAPTMKASRLLDTLLEVMDLMQLDCSTRHAARADVTITPRFGPATWRDFQLADLFLAAGRAAAQERLPALRALARPQSCGAVLGSGGMYGSATVHV